MATRSKIDDEPKAGTELPLHLKYRPRRLADVMGQDLIVKNLQRAMEAKSRPHCYLFTGPAGTGKTTLARIVAAECGITGHGIVEHDGASKSGIDDMRGIIEPLAYAGFGDSPNKAIIINECQGLSKQAWDALLTTTEEPPAHAFFFFTSTHPAKIPMAMVTRCQAFHLKPLRRDDILDVLEMVCDKEGFDTSGKVLGMVADAAGGSMRAALTGLANVHALDDLDDVADILQQPLEDEDFIELARQLVQRKLTWPRLTETLKACGEIPAETVRIVVSAYLTSCLMGSKGGKDTEELLFMLRQFAQPFDPALKNAPLLLAFGRILYD